MEVYAYGGAREVGRNCFLVHEKGKYIILDCGVKLGEQTEYPQIPDNMRQHIHDVVVTHAHLDHSGYLPHIFRDGLRPHVHGTKPTRDLITVLLADYARIGGGRKGSGDAFTQKDVDMSIRNFRLHEFNQEFHTGHGFRARLLNAGHILGSAMVMVEGDKRLLYTGDISVRGTKLLDGCERNIHCDALIMESTYGDEELPSVKESMKKLVHEIKETLKEGGHVLIPSFAVGRGQEILLLLEAYMKSGALPETKIYVEGMIGTGMKITRQNIIYANQEIQRRILMSEDDPFKSKYFRTSRRKDKHDVFEEPSIIVSTSGMLTGGPAIGYVEKMAHNPKNKIIFMGYQAEGTPGRKILEGEKEVEFHGEKIKLRMKVAEVRISGHSGKSELIQFAKGIKGLKKVVLIHGEEEGLNSLKESLERSYEVIIPSLGDKINI
ncbi:MBL fold metallo-hydrolase [Candidatus Micrarchaeota archaeon]|nr:MBL fold metallo-hydrolase [Candidatus Micrarchaeota archaeon]